MTKKCDSCIHNSVCMYKENYLKAIEDFKETKYDFPIKFEISCHQYLKDNDYTYQKEDIVDSDKISVGGKVIKGFIDKNPLNNIIKTSNPCEGCSIYEDIIKGKTTVNDACTFCSKSPYMKVGD